LLTCYFYRNAFIREETGRFPLTQLVPYELRDEHKEKKLTPTKEMAHWWDKVLTICLALRKSPRWSTLGKNVQAWLKHHTTQVVIITMAFAILAVATMVWEPWEPMPATPTQKPTTLCNGDFEDQFNCWQHGGELDQSVECDESGCYAVLGNPDYPCYGGVPVGEAWIKQVFQVPEEASSTLSLRYRVFSNDLDLPELDYFQVAINGEPLPERYGNYEWNEPSCDQTPWDSGWRNLTIDLSAYTGEEIEISLHNINGTQPYYNTWTYVDDVSLGTFVDDVSIGNTD